MTNDAAELFQRLATDPGVMVWCAGDVAQAQPVAAGGLDFEIETMAHKDLIPAPTRTVNRRQTDPLERQALVAYREGEIERSHELRASAFLEHEFSDQASAVRSMASSMARDVERYGTKNVVGLCATHGQAEDLADAIRLQLSKVGLIGKDELRGPGWTKDRTYAVGDRMLLHDSIRSGPFELHNGDVVTLTGISSEVLRVRDDEDRDLVLPATFVMRRRMDGAPNVSHAWARTIDGAQGGTWEQVHLLASPALDHERGYVGQSRGRFPTHTWFARRSPETDHGGRLVTDAGAAVATLRAMSRERAKTFSAIDDPRVTEHRLEEMEPRRHRLDIVGAVLARARSSTRDDDHYDRYHHSHNDRQRGGRGR